MMKQNVPRNPPDGLQPDLQAQLPDNPSHHSNLPLQTSQDALLEAFDLAPQSVKLQSVKLQSVQLQHTQQQLRTSEERYRVLFDSIDEGFCIIQVLFDAAGKAVDYRFLELNPAFVRQSGLVNAQGKTMRDFVPDHPGNRFDIYGQVALTGVPVRFESQDEGLDRWFDIYAFRVDDPTDHKVAVLFNNIAERKRAQQERERLLQSLEFERGRLASTFQKAPAFVAVLRGPQHIFEIANPNYFQLVGHRDIIGQPLEKAISEIVGQGYLELLDNVFSSGQSYEGREMPVELQREPNAPPQKIFIDLLLQPLSEADGSVSGILVHGVDITEQVRARRLAEAARKSAEAAQLSAESANRAKDEFLAALSHELRTPLTAIMGWTSILQSGPLSPEDTARGLDTIDRNVRAQARLIEDILDVSRVITGKMRLEMQPVDLAGIIEAAINTVLPSAQAKDVQLQQRVEGACLVSGDPARLQQIVWNLLSNSIKFTPKGGQIQICLKRVASHAEIVVSDSGMGIAPEVLLHVFERFRQGDASSTRLHGGLGLGLSIVRHLLELQGGSVEAESPGPGQGSTFTVKLPLIDEKPLESGLKGVKGRAKIVTAERRVQPPPKLQTAPQPLPRLDGLQVLVVDDQQDTRVLLKMVLEQCGAQVLLVASVAEALATLEETRPDVLLSDIGMPGEDGFSLIKQVRALSPEAGRHIPAAALTAFVRTEDRIKILQSGFQIHIPKPIEPMELTTIVASLAGRREPG